MKSELRPLKSSAVIGFDSAWTDKPSAPGAICAVTFDNDGNAGFLPHKLASFSEALEFAKRCSNDFAFSLLAIDQPTIVRNATGSRTVDKVAASLVSFIGGGVQPANRSKIGMFCDSAPVWPFLSHLDFIEDPFSSLNQTRGTFLMEVFPALALPALEPIFATRLGAPKYNPARRKKFKLSDWRAVVQVVQRSGSRVGVLELASWANHMQEIAQPQKADQDKIDAAICALVGLNWLTGTLSPSAMIGDLDTGYMITPVSGATAGRLELAAQKQGIAFAVN